MKASSMWSALPDYKRRDLQTRKKYPSRTRRHLGPHSHMVSGDNVISLLTQRAQV